MTIIVKHTKVSTVPDTTDTDLVRPSDWNADHTLTGLGTMAEQNANNVAITGGSISGATVSGYIPTSEKGAALGVATLDAGGKVPTSQIPMQGDLNYQGTWNATTNTPTLVSSTGTKGYYYVVDVAGTTNLNGITDWQIGDWAIFNGTVWQKVDNTDAVTSVNGQVGTVVLTTTNIAEGTNEYFTTARARASISAGTGISYDNGTGVVTNSAPDQTVSITDGIGIDVTGTYPSFTITNTAPDQTVAFTDGTGIDVTGTYPNFTVTNTAPDQTVSIASGTGISTSGTYPAFTVTNTAPDQVVSLTQGGTTTITGTYPNFTISSDDQFDGTVTSVSATAGTGISITGSPITSSGTLNITNTAPDQVVALASGTGISVTGTYPSFTVTNTAPSSGGTVTSVGGTGTVNGISLSGTVTSSGNLTLGGTLSGVSLSTQVTGTLPIANGGTGETTRQAAIDALAGAVTSGQYLRGNGTDVVMSAIQAADVPTLNQNTTGTASNVTGTVAVANGGTGLTSLTANRVPYGNGTSALGNEADFTYDPSLNTVTAPQVQASNGIFVNSATVTASYSIPSGSNAMSAGTISIANGITVTVPNGNTWVIV